jgi:hypothetical protein
MSEQLERQGRIVRILNRFIDNLFYRITELEADNARLTHVLEVIADSDGHHDHSLTHRQLIEYAKEALDKGTG